MHLPSSQVPVAIVARPYRAADFLSHQAFITSPSSSRHWLLVHRPSPCSPLSRSGVCWTPVARVLLYRSPSLCPAAPALVRSLQCSRCSSRHNVFTFGRLYSGVYLESLADLLLLSLVPCVRPKYRCRSLWIAVHL